MSSTTALPTYGGALLRYRIMAFVTGTALLLGCFVAVPLQIWGDEQAPAAIIWTAHGFLFIVYLIATLELGVRMRWNPIRLLLTMAAGTIPFLSFVAERNVHHLVVERARVESGSAPATA
ncbi:MAG: DUF3817 domain-containing protein [Actinobacteria bacterium]|nr:DUF3817 domain-containing protein [Actinomycetota bacterium]